MRTHRFASLTAATVLAVAPLGACSSHSGPLTLAKLLASLPETSVDQPAGPFVVGYAPRGHVITNVGRGNLVSLEPSSWCAGKVCASRAFAEWRSGYASYPYFRWPKGSDVVTFDAPAPRVDDGREFVFPTESAIDVSLLPGSRADLAIGAAYNVMGSYQTEHNTPQDVWSDRRLVRVGAAPAVLTESYGTTDRFPLDVKALYFEGPHHELGVVRATTNIFYPTANGQQDGTDKAERIRAARRAAERQTTSDVELVAVAASVRAATDAEFDAAANRVLDGRVCALDPEHKNTRQERVIISGPATPNGQPAWTLRQGRGAAGRATCPTGFTRQWRTYWGDWQRSTTHAVYYEFWSGSDETLFALAPRVRTLRVTGFDRQTVTVPAEEGIDGVRWALSAVSPRLVTALDATGRVLETVRTDLAGP